MLPRRSKSQLPQARIELDGTHLDLDTVLGCHFAVEAGDVAEVVEVDRTGRAIIGNLLAGIKGCKAIGIVVDDHAGLVGNVGKVVANGFAIIAARRRRRQSQDDDLVVQALWRAGPRATPKAGAREEPATLDRYRVSGDGPVALKIRLENIRSRD